MRYVFCIFKYFPYGGLQRDFLKIALECQRRGHQIAVYTLQWQAEVPQGFEIEIIPSHALTNAGRCLQFAMAVKKRLQESPADCVIGFNKILGLDIYFCGDSCFVAREKYKKNFLFRFGFRYRIYSAMERAVFEKTSKTKILTLTASEKKKYQYYYQTSEERFHQVPPGIICDPMDMERVQKSRDAFRHEMNIPEGTYLLLMVGSGFQTKGLDRSLLAFASLPNELRRKCLLWVVGEGTEKPFVRMAQKLGVDGQVMFWGPRSDVFRFMSGADILLHPSYHELAGMVLLEAMAAGLPILVSDVCGYAFHVAKAKAGRLVSSPFKQKEMNEILENMLRMYKNSSWKVNGMSYVGENDLTSLPEKAADIIDSFSKYHRRYVDCKKFSQ